MQAQSAQNGTTQCGQLTADRLPLQTHLCQVIAGQLNTVSQRECQVGRHVGGWADHRIAAARGFPFSHTHTTVTAKLSAIQSLDCSMAAEGVRKAAVTRHIQFSHPPLPLPNGPNLLPLLSDLNSKQPRIQHGSSSGSSSRVCENGERVATSITTLRCSHPLAQLALPLLLLLCTLPIRLLTYPPSSPSGCPQQVVPIVNWPCWVVLWWLGSS